MRIPGESIYIFLFLTATGEPVMGLLFFNIRYGFCLKVTTEIHFSQLKTRARALARCFWESHSSVT